MSLDTSGSEHCQNAFEEWILRKDCTCILWGIDGLILFQFDCNCSIHLIYFGKPKTWISVVLYFLVSVAAFRIVPTRLQIFEYTSVSFTCEGFNVLAGWRVRNAKEFLKTCSNDIMMTTVTCTIEYALNSDSGEYWCEGGGGERSNTAHITVTGMLTICSFKTSMREILPLVPHSVFQKYVNAYLPLNML